MQPEAVSRETADELEVLYPAPRAFTIAGRDVQIPEASFRMCGQVYSLGLALTVRLAFLPDFDATALTVDVMRYGEVIEQHPAEAVDLLHAGTGLDRDWLASLSALDKCELASAWIEVNGDFFARWLHTRSRMAAAVGSLNAGAGPTSSTPSASTATPIQKATPRGKSNGTSSRASAPTRANGATG